MNTEVEKPLVFLNQPVKRKEDDVIGSYYDAEIISSAIDKDAEMIAVTSSFGAGKSSVTDLIEVVRGLRQNEQMIKISMWSQLNNPEHNTNPDVTASIREMHRNFLYQIISQMSKRRGSYVIKKLSANYDSLSVNLKSCWQVVLFVVSLAVFLFLYAEAKGITVIASPLLRGLLLVGAILMMLIAIINNEILFSIHSTKRQKEISVDELINIYKEEVLTKRRCQGGIERLIVVIEDLDRTNNSKAVLDFLIQLRRYYVESKANKKVVSGSNRRYRKVTFIVNLKKESMLNSTVDVKKTTGLEDKEDTINGEDKFFEKVFDFIYDLNEINDVDYEYVLKQLLSNEDVKDSLNSMGLCNEDPSKIPGMSWIVHGEQLNIRLIKDRLNRSLSKYYILRNRAQNKEDIVFEKCAAAAYLATTFEHDICKMEDRFVEEIIDAKIEGMLDNKKHLSKIKEKYTKLSGSFIEEIMHLIEEGIIESDYREYLFNYPEKAKTVSHEELIIQNAILYRAKYSDKDVNDAVHQVLSHNSDIIKESLKKMEDLGQKLPVVVFKNEKLFAITMKESVEGVYKWFKESSYKAGMDEVIDVISSIFSYENSDTIISSAFVESLCASWEGTIEPENMLPLRKRICQVAGRRIEDFKSLFFGNYPIISEAELECLPIEKGIDLINLQSAGFTNNYLGYINGRITEEGLQNTIKAEQFFIRTVNLGNEDVSKLHEYIDFMRILEKDIPELSNPIINMGGCLATWEEGKPVAQQLAEQFEQLIHRYVQFINQLASTKLEEGTKDNIQKLLLLGRFHNSFGFSNEVANKMDDGEHTISSIIVYLENNSAISFGNGSIVAAANNNKNYFIKNKGALKQFRTKLLKEGAKEIKHYKRLFDKECGLITDEEIETLMKLKKRFNDTDVLGVIDAEAITPESLNYLAKFFSRKKQGSTFAYNYFIFISIINPALGRRLIEQTDFYKIQYFKIPLQKRKEILGKIDTLLSAIGKQGPLWFMENVRFADPLLTSEIESDVMNNSTTRDKLIAIVNDSNYGTTKREVLTIITKGEYCALREDASELLGRIGKTDWYIASKMLYKKQFEYENNEELWPTYTKLFLGNNGEIATLMSKNEGFVEDALARKVFSVLKASEKDKRKRFVNAKQTKGSLVDIYNNYDQAFKEEYYSAISGFIDQDAAAWFVDMIINDPVLIRSYSIYSNTHDKLDDGKLKWKYTYNRNRLGQ